MKVKRCVAVAMCILMAAGIFSACQSSPEDVVGKVGETPIYRWYYNAHLYDQLQLYLRNTGINLTLPAYSTELQQYKKYRLDELVGLFALIEEARVRGIDKLTQEQEAEVLARYGNYYDVMIAAYIKQYGTDEEGRRKAEEAYIAQLEKSSLTPERMRESMRLDYIAELMLQEIAASEPISDEELRTIYDERLKTEKETYEADPAEFALEASDYSIYIPEGYVETARIAIKFSSEQNQTLSEKYAVLNSAMEEYYVAIEATPDTAEQYKAKVDAATKTFSDALEVAYQSLYERMNAIREKALAGEDFIELMESESEDRRKISYYVAALNITNVPAEYRIAALELENIGDISEAVRIEDGLCIIQLRSRLTPGVRSFEEVYDALKIHETAQRSLELMLSVQNEYAQKADEAGLVELFYNRI